MQHNLLEFLRHGGSDQYVDTKHNGTVTPPDTVPWVTEADLRDVSDAKEEALRQWDERSPAPAGIDPSLRARLFLVSDHLWKVESRDGLGVASQFQRD